MFLLEALIGLLLLVCLGILLLLWRLLITEVKLRDESLRAQLSLERLLLNTTAEMVRAIEDIQRTRKGA